MRAEDRNFSHGRGWTGFTGELRAFFYRRWVFQWLRLWGRLICCA